MIARGPERDDLPGGAAALPWGEGRKAFQAKAYELCARDDVGRVCDIGGGANPIIASRDVHGLGVEYTLLDVSETELAKAPQEMRRYVADIAAPGFASPQLFDLVISRTVLEHVADPAQFHRNVFAMLRPGGYALHLYPTLYALPFVVNRLLPEFGVRQLLLVAQPFRTADGQHGKFPALYRWCRGPTRRQLRHLERVGYEIIVYRPLYGHDYYKRVGALAYLEQLKTRALLRHPVPWLTSYAYVVLRRPD